MGTAARAGPGASFRRALVDVAITGHGTRWHRRRGAVSRHSRWAPSRGLSALTMFSVMASPLKIKREYGHGRARRGYGQVAPHPVHVPRWLAGYRCSTP